LLLLTKIKLLVVLLLVMLILDALNLIEVPAVEVLVDALLVARGASGNRAANIDCYNCRLKGYYMRDCPQNTLTHYAAVEYDTSDPMDDAIFMARRTRVGLGDFDIILDNQATESVFKSAAL